MTRIGQQARITLKGFDREGIDHNSPLEDQVVLVYRAARRYAESNNFKKGTHRGHTGLTGPMVMKRITESLFPDTDADHLERLNGLINQVLRKTDACVCVAHPEKREDMPLWFVNDHMPANIVVVALSHAKNKAPLAPVTDDWRDRQEARLTAEEAGETKTPGPVQVSFVEPSKVDASGTRDKAFEEARQRIAAEHAQFVSEILRTIHKSPIPLTAMEIHQLLPSSGEPTALRKVLAEQVANRNLYYRVETEAEQLVRGGGVKPRGKRAQLYWPAQQVPERSSLPEGVAPHRPAAEWSAEAKERLDKNMDIVLDVLARSYPKGSNRPRTSGRIAEVGGITTVQVKLALERLIQLDLVYDAGRGSYYLTDRKRGPKRSTLERHDEPSLDYDEEYDDEEYEEDPVQFTPPEAPPAPEQPVTEDRAQMVREFMKLAHRLAAPEESEEVEQLRRDKARLEKENEKLRSAVASLRDTIATLTDI